MVAVAHVDASDTDATKVPYRLDALINNLASIRFQASGQLDGVRPALGVLASDTLNGNVRAATVGHFLQPRHNTLAASKLREVHELDSGIPLAHEVQTPVLVDHDDAAGLVHQSELSAHLADGTGAPNSDDVALINPSVHDAVPARAEHVGEVQTLLVWHVVRELEQVVVAIWHTSVLRLTTSETSREVRVAEHASSAAAVHGVLDRVRVRALALRRLLLVAVVAVSAGDLETGNDSVALLQVLHAGPHLVDNAAEFMAEDVAFLQLDDRAVVQV